MLHQYTWCDRAQLWAGLKNNMQFKTCPPLAQDFKMKYYRPQSTGEQQRCWEKGMQLEQCNYTIPYTMHLKQNQLIVVYSLVDYMHNTTFIFLIYFCCKEKKICYYLQPDERGCLFRPNNSKYHHKLYENNEHIFHINMCSYTKYMFIH